MELHSHKVQFRSGHSRSCTVIKFWSGHSRSCTVIKFRSGHSRSCTVIKFMSGQSMSCTVIKFWSGHSRNCTVIKFRSGHSRSCTAIKFRSGQSHGAVVSLAATHTELPRLVPYELDRLLLISSTRTRTLQRSFQETTRCALKLLECFGEIAPVPFWRFCSRLIEKSHCQTSPTDSVS